MVMAQGFTQEQVKAILEDIDGSSLIDEKTKKLLGLAKMTTENSYKIHDDAIQELRSLGCSDEEIFEAISVTSQEFAKRPRSLKGKTPMHALKIK